MTEFLRRYCGGVQFELRIIVNESFAFIRRNVRMTDHSAGALTDAKAKKRPWAETAAAVRERLEAVGERPSAKSRLLSELSVLSGYSVPVLLRQQALMAGLDRIAGVVGVDIAQLRGLPFSILELAMTHYRRNREAGLDAIGQVIAGTADVKTLRVALNSASAASEPASGPDVAARERHERRDRVFESLKTRNPDIVPRDKDWGMAEARRRGFTRAPICRFDWWRRRGRTETPPGILEGFDLTYAPFGMTAKWLDDRIARILVSSSFFDLYWIVFAGTSPFIERFDEAVSILGRFDVGFMTVFPDGSLRIDREPRLIRGRDPELIWSFAPDRAAS